LLLTTLDIYSDIPVPISEVQKSSSSSNVSRVLSAIIFPCGEDQSVKSVMGLHCKLNYHAMRDTDEVYDTMRQLQNHEKGFEPPWSGMSMQRQLISCSISNEHMLSNDLVQEWALAWNKKERAGAIGKFQGPLCALAACYKKGAQRPLVSHYTGLVHNSSFSNFSSTNLSV
jgi:hypothetical protein